MNVNNDALLIAQELRRLRRDPPSTIGDALPVFAKALHNARAAGASPEAVLLIGEILWVTIRPEREPAPDSIGDALDRLWGRLDDERLAMGKR
jgi:hypothetical protein